MTAFADRTDPSAVAGISPDAAAGVTRLSSREEKRFSRLQIWLWGKRFGVRLKTGAQRMKQLLHAGG